MKQNYLENIDDYIDEMQYDIFIEMALDDLVVDSSYEDSNDFRFNSGDVIYYDGVLYIGTQCCYSNFECLKPEFLDALMDAGIIRKGKFRSWFSQIAFATGMVEITHHTFCLKLFEVFEYFEYIKLRNRILDLPKPAISFKNIYDFGYFTPSKYLVNVGDEDAEAEHSVYSGSFELYQINAEYDQYEYS